MKNIIALTVCFFIIFAAKNATAQNGNIQYSQVVKVNVKKTVEAVSVYPNPVEGSTINMNLTAERGSYSLALFNQMGQIVLSQTINHNGGTANIPVEVFNNFISGIYQLKVVGNDFSQAITVVKP